VSIWASLQGIDGWSCPGVGTDDTGSLRRMKFLDEGWPGDTRPCAGCEECEVGSPYEHQQNVKPSADDPRSGHIGLASIPGYVHAPDRGPDTDYLHGDSVAPFLRLDVTERYWAGKGHQSATVTLDERQVKHLRDQFTEWLDMDKAPWYSGGYVTEPDACQSCGEPTSGGRACDACLARAEQKGE
jgi:ferredoxin